MYKVDDIKNIKKIKVINLKKKISLIEILYQTPNNQLWGIDNLGVKFCILKKNNKHKEAIINDINQKPFISYKDSKLFKKFIKFEILEKEVKIYLKKVLKIVLLIKSEKENQIVENQKKNIYTYIDLFSGAGGFSLGFKQAGLKHIYGIDSWSIASKTYQTNIGLHFCKDIEVSEPIKLEQEVDVVIGSPPCQAFSLANRRSTNTLKGSLLYKSFLKYVLFYNAKIFVLENVMGLLSCKNKDGSKFIDSIVKDFNANYLVKIFKICCSKFGVPQKRRRVFIIGVRKDIGFFFSDLKENICTEKLESFLLGKLEVSAKFFLSQKAIAGIKKKTELSEIKGYGFQGGSYLNLNSYSNTIVASYWKSGYSSLIKYNENEIRKLTEWELKRIQSFPEDFTFFGTKKDRYIQIGNAVPPKMAYFLGQQIIEFLNLYIKK